MEKGIAAEYFGHHVHIHTPIVTKIGGLRDNMGPEQNPEFLQNRSIDGRNIGYIL